jgi:diguanylate cyclase (GGDEF)-like protein
MVDLPTLLAVTVLATGISGVLLIFAWFTNQRTPALALWATGYVMSAVGLALIVARGQIDDFWSIDMANALLITAYGIVWTGARSFNGRSTPGAYILLGSAAWLLARQFDVFQSSVTARIAFVSALVFGYTALTGLEFWRSDRKLSSCWPLIAIIGLHAAVFLSRVFWPGWMVQMLTGRQPALSVMALFSFELLFHSFCAAFLLAFLVKERREQHYKRASLVDPLTGIWNRRAFLDQASRNLSRAAMNRQAVAFIAFDLDRFKSINDSYGHLAGDKILCGFGSVVTEALRPGDVFGRIGGEEFACLLGDVSPAGAAMIAERLRERVADMEVDFGPSRLRTTVSLGVVIATRPQPDLEALMSAADRALYRAKECGRNRVEFAKLSSVPVQKSARR